MKAEAIAAECGKKYYWREGGQNLFEVFDLPEAEQIAPEYDILLPDEKQHDQD